MIPDDGAQPPACTCYRELLPQEASLFGCKVHIHATEVMICRSRSRLSRQPRTASPRILFVVICIFREVEDINLRHRDG